MRSDMHLEETLSDLNARVHAAEATGPSIELVELYVNRGTVLRLMGSVLSAVSDYEEAADMVDFLECSDARVDPGLFVKIHVNMGGMFRGDASGTMAECYATAATRLWEVGAESKHYSDRELVVMCISCANDLIEASVPSGAVPFISRAVSTLQGSSDPWHMNRTVEALNVSAKAFMDTGMDGNAFEAFDEAIGIGMDLLRDGTLEDPFELVFSLIYKGDLHERVGDMEGFVKCHTAAADAMEDMAATPRGVDNELLADVHRGISMALMAMGRTAEAEKHLLRAMALDAQMGRESDFRIF